MIDYSVQFDQGTSTWIEVATGVTETAYLTTMEVVAGTPYKFKVRARNSVGFGLYSEPVEIIAAHPPDAPVQLSSTAATSTGTQVSLDWSAGADDGGSDVIDYTVSYRVVDTNGY